jgi:hypothetical protein
VIQRDYIERVIEQCVQAIAHALRLRGAGQHREALQIVQEAEEKAAGDLRPILDRLEAASAVEVAGLFERERVRVYAALLGEEALIYRELGNASSAHLCSRRAAELYGALSLAGARLGQLDLDRIAVLCRNFALNGLDAGYREELNRLVTATE